MAVQHWKSRSWDSSGIDISSDSLGDVLGSADIRQFQINRGAIGPAVIISKYCGVRRGQSQSQRLGKS